MSTAANSNKCDIWNLSKRRRRKDSIHFLVLNKNNNRKKFFVIEKNNCSSTLSLSENKTKSKLEPAYPFRHPEK